MTETKFADKKALENMQGRTEISQILTRVTEDRSLRESDAFINSWAQLP